MRRPGLARCGLTRSWVGLAPSSRLATSHLCSIQTSRCRLIMSEEGSAAASESGPPALSGVDVATLVVFFLMLGSVSVWATRKQQASQSASASSETYFLAERAVPFWAVGASLFMSNIGAEHFVGLAGTAARSGIAVGWYEWGAMPAVLVMGYFFLPVYSSMGVSTMPEYIERRYNKKARTLLVCLSLVLYIFTKISATLFAGQVVLDAVSHLNPWLSAALMIVGTAAYTTLGGLSAVVYTEAMQTVVLLVGGGILAFVGFSEVGGLPGLRKELPDSFFHLFRPVTDKDFPWTGFVSGYCECAAPDRPRMRSDRAPCTRHDVTMVLGL